MDSVSVWNANALDGRELFVRQDFLLRDKIGVRPFKVDCSCSASARGPEASPRLLVGLLARPRCSFAARRRAGRLLNELGFSLPRLRPRFGCSKCSKARFPPGFDFVPRRARRSLRLEVLLLTLPIRLRRLKLRGERIKFRGKRL